MDQQLNLIFELKDLKKNYKENTVLSIGRLQFHRGTIYGIVGPIGSFIYVLIRRYAND